MDTLLVIVKDTFIVAVGVCVVGAVMICLEELATHSKRVRHSKKRKEDM